MPISILLIDSHSASRTTLAALLRDHGYAVLEAQNGVEGLHHVRHRLPDLIIVDLWPFYSASLQMMERLRKSDIAQVPVLVHTSPVSPEYRERALSAGCAGYLEKPTPPDRLLAEMERILRAGVPRLTIRGHRKSEIAERLEISATTAAPLGDG